MIKTFEQFISESCVSPIKVNWQKVDSINFEKYKHYVLKRTNKYNKVSYTSFMVPPFGLDIPVDEEISDMTYEELINKYEYAINIEETYTDDCWRTGKEGMKAETYYLIRFPYSEQDKRLDPGRVKQYGGWKYQVEWCWGEGGLDTILDRSKRKYAIEIDSFEWIELN